jgi:hypothetical protein
MDTIDVSRETRLFARNHNAYSQVDALFADLAQVLAASASRPWLDPARAGNYLRKTTQAGPYWYYMQ